MKSHRVMLAAVIVSAALASSAYAHHSHPYFYDQCRTVTIEGRVERVEWKNPHTWITLELDDRMVYTIDWISLDALMRDGVLGAAQAAVVPGARIAVTGNPIRPTAQI